MRSELPVEVLRRVLQSMALRLRLNPRQHCQRCSSALQEELARQRMQHEMF